MNQICSKINCGEKLHGLNSKSCKLCEQRVCLKHLQPENHDCLKVIYTKYIRKNWLRKFGQNVTTSTYIIVCETCGFVSELSSLIEYADVDLESHLNNNSECKVKKKTFLEEFDIEPIPKGVRIESSLVRDPDRTYGYVRIVVQPRKFTSHDEYIGHHYTHS